MKRAVADPFPAHIDVVRSKRRSVELSLSRGQLVARAPLRTGKAELEEILVRLRQQLWDSLRRRSIFENDELYECAQAVAAEYLSDQNLPAYKVRFTTRMRTRWASCTSYNDRAGSIRVSCALIGHPRWVFEHILLHELIHLRVPNHGPEFHRLLARSPHGQRADGYIEALERTEQWGQIQVHSVVADIERDEQEKEGQQTLPLFENPNPLQAEG